MRAQISPHSPARPSPAANGGEWRTESRFANAAPLAGEPRVDAGAEVLGAGHVVGIDPRMIARIDPAPGARGFEPNDMPLFVEFADADFPWRYSFDATVGARVTPWLVLLALKPGEFEFLDQGNAQLERIRIPDPGLRSGSLSEPSRRP